MDTLFIAALAIVAVVVLLLIVMTRGRLSSLDVDFRKLLVKARARPDAKPDPDHARIKIRDTQLDGQSSIDVASTASLTADRNRLDKGSRINVYEPGGQGSEPSNPKDRDG